IVRNKNNSIQCIVEYKDATDQEKQIMEINTGIYCFDAQSLFLALEKVTNNNKQKEYYLTDTLEILNEEKKLVTSVILEDMIEASGVNSQKQLSNLENEFYRRQDHFEN
ncbi:MAG: bifunctional N-acetylglucosamine-1-phosphate uridyltransferase/glucosamine-1-phosphate acetyltransferase, partial [Candidatus Cloacimonetes bacterium]|nr:bifunctional N-acetylglucosamine-1-phosphate uridyltransferase/glucosamine-1-phosphate acetyltransferase [Candidatus Cloacimonadota bacterium]